MIGRETGGGERVGGGLCLHMCILHMHIHIYMGIHLYTSCIRTEPHVDRHTDLPKICMHTYGHV